MQLQKHNKMIIGYLNKLKTTQKQIPEDGIDRVMKV